MPAKGTLAITARGDGTRWYGRVSIAVAVAREASLKEGVKVSARCVDGVIVIQADDHGRIRFPPARGKADPKHAFEAATTTLGLREVRLYQAVAEIEVSKGQIRMKVPEECLSNEIKKIKKPRKETSKAPTAPPEDDGLASPRLYGTAAAIVTEAGRAGKVVRPMTVGEMVAKIVEMGQDVKPVGPRFFTLNGRGATVADLLDEVNRLCGSTELDRIALILD